jgi:hypothetical protein
MLLLRLLPAELKYKHPIPAVLVLFVQVIIGLASARLRDARNLETAVTINIFQKGRPMALFPYLTSYLKTRAFVVGETGIPGARRVRASVRRCRLRWVNYA